MGRTPPKGVQRSLDMSGSSPPACELSVLRRTNDDLKITIRPPVCTVVGDSTTPGGAMLRHLTIMESVNEEAGTRARDSARLAARRPGRRHRPGDVSVLGRPQRLLRDGERVCFCTNYAFLSRFRFTNGIMTKGDLAPENAQNEGITHGMKMRIVLIVRVDRKVPSCISMSLSHTCITIS